MYRQHAIINVIESKGGYFMKLEQQLESLKFDYVRLQNDLEKRESTSQQVEPLIKQLEDIEHQISKIRTQLHAK